MKFNFLPITMRVITSFWSLFVRALKVTVAGHLIPLYPLELACLLACLLYKESPSHPTFFTPVTVRNPHLSSLTRPLLFSNAKSLLFVSFRSRRLLPPHWSWSRSSLLPNFQSRFQLESVNGFLLPRKSGQISSQNHGFLPRSVILLVLRVFLNPFL